MIRMMDNNIQGGVTMEDFLKTALSDYAIISYEVIGIIIAVAVGNIFNGKIKTINADVQSKEHERLYSELDDAIGNSKRR